ncbi:MAG TPA: UDP-3-O-(3-hydroxymyristoyl)glucosamine N-acyltransferase [Acidobacteriota bacterium]|jgi:UDP-3-O-[3-hydroxymyristoyl] glucosamine N-acyltransferase|nr:UDP-3-O-(3-hydroxymyristoyl)glucosamine N-acyltransferase [Acidobacteriota bacterium]
MQKTLRELADIAGGSVTGDPKICITGIRSFEDAGPSDLVLVASSKFLKKIDETKAGAFLVADKIKVVGHNLLRVSNPKLAFAKLLLLFYPPERLQPGIHPTAYVDPLAEVDRSAHVGAFVYIGPCCRVAARCQIFPGTVLMRNVIVGNGTVLYSNVSVYGDVEIGSETIVHSGSVLGSDGYGFVYDGQEHVKIPQVGGVRIGNRVEIGAGCCIDRATLGVTELRDGVKLDNLVHIGHNCVIGARSLLIAQVGLSGGTRLGESVTLAGQVGTNPQVEIGDRTVVTAKAGVSKSVPADLKVSGMPPIDHERWIRAQILYARLPEMHETLKNLQKEVERLKREKANGSD